VGKSRQRKELYKSGNRRAYRLSARDLEEVWKNDQPSEKGIVEDYPVDGA
jgi:predicted heme/steroid binding protein